MEEEVKFFGHIVNAEGITVDPEKVKAIQNYPVPKTLKRVHRFLGLSGWHHHFVPRFSKIAEPLNNLKKKGQPFLWSSVLWDLEKWQYYMGQKLFTVVTDYAAL